METGVSKSSIEYLILCTQSPDYYLPTTACILQDRLGLNTSCGAVDYNLGCSGYIYGLGIYKDLPSEVYLPNKNSVKPENQAIFPIGGGYHEVFPI